MNQLAPIFIASPLRRSGTTLIQRLLCSSPDTVIYGEPVANDINMFINLFLNKQMQFSQSAAEWDNWLAMVLNGEVNDWIADMMPPVGPYLQSYQKHTLHLLAHLKEESAKYGRTIYGVKMAEWPTMILWQLQRMLPQSKLIYIVRDLEGCVRSAKKTGMIQGLQETQQFCSTWQQQFTYMKTQYPKDRMLWIDYATIASDPDGLLKELSAFTGSTSIQASVLNHKVNNYKSDLDRDPSGNGYLAPEHLNEEELQLIAQFKEIKS